MSSYLRFSVTKAAAGNYLYHDLSSVSNYNPVDSATFFEYEILWEGTTDSRFGFDFDNAAQSAPLRDQGLLDQNSIAAAPNTDLTAVAADRWYKRKISVSGYSGQNLAFFDICRVGNTAADTAVARYRNIWFTDGADPPVIRKNIWTSGDAAPSSTQHLISGSPSFSLTVVEDAPVHRQPHPAHLVRAHSW